MSRYKFFKTLKDSSVPLDYRISMIVAMAGTVGNTLGFAANLILYGMSFPTAVCGICALLLIVYYFLILSTRFYRGFSWVMLGILSLLEFPMLVFAYGSVMYPYMILGFLALLMMSRGTWRLVLTLLMASYDAAVIALSSIHPFVFGPQDSTGLLGSAVVTFLITLGALSALVLTWQRVSVSETSSIDSVTGAMNRTGFSNHAEKYLKGDHASRYAIVFFDVKNFKAVNTICGIAGGNRLLHQIAEQLKQSVLRPKLTARLNADHFVCLVEKERLNYQKLNEMCEFTFSDNGKSFPILMTCGIYPVENDSLSVETMCDKAATARRFVHGGQSKHFEIYSSSSDQVYQAETSLLGELEAAIRESSFVPYYQPVVDCKTKKIVSAEALARWVHPERGVISPGIFIPILEKKELISDLDAIIADKAAFLQEQQMRAGKPIVPVSVNLSRVDLYDNGFMEQLQTLVERATYHNLGYRFEVTESSYEALPESSIEMLASFRRAGAKILVDDFGSGYSSLGMITDYEYDFIKLDMSFVSKLDTNEKVRGVVRSLISMTHELGAKVIAEGVETQSQFDFLAEAGCDYVQGYFFFRPLPERDFLEALEKQQ